MPSLSKIALTAAAFAAPAFGAGATGKSTRYWDCCKPSCAWTGKADVSAPVNTCDANNNPLSNPDATSGCDGGTAYTCGNFSPWKVSDSLSYGFAATAISGGTESSWCCACYQITFTSTAVSGKTMIVQSTNTGGDLGSNHFDLLMPGGGVGIFDGCTPQFGGLAGAQYGGISDVSSCDSFPTFLQDGCKWRFDWFQNADNPELTFERVQCPSALTDISGCKRNDDSSYPLPSVAGTDSSSSSKSSSAAASSSSTAAAASSSAAASSAASSAVASSAASSAAAVPSSSAGQQTQSQQQPSSTQGSGNTSAESAPTSAAGVSSSSAAASPTASKEAGKCKRSNKAKRHLHQHLHH
ncbi:unnamed protein product [Clonostachys rosea]|uniref:Cellulase n=1 Tax=Bionectria ochroleuca TaxID=29856 RepID=A0ABY6UF04_BIOOC|nr:unnamed protein product [Clonostachys rosea]